MDQLLSWLSVPLWRKCREHQSLGSKQCCSCVWNSLKWKLLGSSALSQAQWQPHHRFQPWTLKDGFCKGFGFSLGLAAVVRKVRDAIQNVPRVECDKCHIENETAIIGIWGQLPKGTIFHLSPRNNLQNLVGAKCLPQRASQAEKCVLDVQTVQLRRRNQAPQSRGPCSWLYSLPAEEAPRRDELCRARPHCTITHA